MKGILEIEDQAKRMLEAAEAELKYRDHPKVAEVAELARAALAGCDEVRALRLGLQRTVSAMKQIRQDAANPLWPTPEETLRNVIQGIDSMLLTHEQVEAIGEGYNLTRNPFPELHDEGGDR